MSITTTATITRPAGVVTTIESIPLQNLDHVSLHSDPNATSCPRSFRSVSDQQGRVDVTEPTPSLRAASPNPNDDLFSTQGQPQPTPIYPEGVPLAILMTSACLSLILTEMDSQILATAIPSITATFATTADIGWYSSTYRLAVCSLQFMFGKLYRTYSLKYVFLTSLAIFEVGSAICGGARTSGMFILGRVIAGMGSSGVIAGCFLILTLSFPLRYRPAMSSVAGLFEGFSTIAAPSIGGIITEKLSWRWCFYINLPFGVVTLVLLAIFLKDPPARPPNAHLPWKQKIVQLDPVGTAVFIPAVTCFLIALQYGATTFGWDDARTIALFVIAGSLLVAFAWVQWKRQDAATLPPRIIRQRSIFAGFLFGLCTNSAFNVITYYLPIYFQVVKQLSPAEAGYLLMPAAGGFILALILAGPAVSIVGFYVPFMLASSIVMPIATGLLTTLRVDGPLTNLIIYEVMFGLGCGVGFQGPQVAVATTLLDADVAMGLNIIVFAQNFGPALFVSVAQSLFSTRLVSNLKVYAPDLNSNALESMSLADIKGLIPASELQEALLGYDKAITQTFYLCVVLTCLMIVASLGMEWRSVKEKRN